MKRIMPKIFFCVIFATLFAACKKDFLEFPYTEGPVDEENVWGSDRNARGYLNFAYRGFNFLDRYNLGGGALLASGSDEAVNSDLGAAVNVLNNGAWGPMRTFDDPYANMYAYIRMANTFLEKAPTSVIFPVEDIPSLRGEAFFLRAMYHFELFKRYGRIVLVTKTLTSSDNLNLPRNSIDEVVSQITADCDSATALITAVWTGEGTTVPFNDGYNAANRGRATKAAAMALKSRLLLYYASPLHNTANDLLRWQAAAASAKAVINLNKHALLTRVQLPSLWDYNTSLVYNKEVIFATSANARNDIEANNAPIGFRGALGRTNPTQDLVDAFEMANGKPISDPTSGYLPSNPYVNRDPRLALFIITNGSTFKTGTLTRAVETYVDGQDNILTNVNSTKTGYYMRKFLSEAASYNIAGAAQRRRPWVIFRYAETLLNHAEALNESDGPTPDVYTSVNAVRIRGGLPVLSTGLTQSQMRDRIRNERRVELSFEEHRFFDVRRWKLGETIFNAPVRGMRITKLGTVLTYTPFVVETRVFTPKNYFYPIAQDELSKAPALGQNSGY